MNMKERIAKNLDLPVRLSPGSYLDVLKNPEHKNRIFALLRDALIHVGPTGVFIMDFDDIKHLGAYYIKDGFIEVSVGPYDAVEKKAKEDNLDIHIQIMYESERAKALIGVMPSDLRNIDEGNRRSTWTL